MRSTWTSFAQALGRVNRKRRLSLAMIMVLLIPVSTVATLGALRVAMLRGVERFPDGDRLVRVLRARRDGATPLAVSRLHYLAWRQPNNAFAAIAAVRSSPGPQVLDVSTSDRSARARVGWVTHELFGVMSLRPLTGRLFVPLDASPGALPVAIIDVDAARRIFGSPTEAVGRQVSLHRPTGTISHVVVGVVSGAARLQWREPLDIYVPEPDESDEGSPTAWLASEYEVLGRLQRSVGVETAARELASALRPTTVASDDSPKVVVEFVADIESRLIQPAVDAAVTVGVVTWLAATLNISAMLIGISAGRQNEYSVRYICGARLGQVRSQILLECLLIGTGLAVVSAVAATWMVQVLSSWAPARSIPVPVSLTTNNAPALLAVLFAMVSGLICGVLVASNCAVASGLGADLMRRTARHGWADALVAMQCGLGFAMLLPAGLLLASYTKMLEIPLGFDPRGVHVASVLLGDVQLDGGRFQVLQRRLTEEVRALPGVETVALSDGLPFGRGGPPPRVGIRLDLSNGAIRRVLYRSVTSDYFSVLGIRILTGTGFAPAEGGCQFVVNTRFDAVFGRAVGRTAFLGATACRIVGVAADALEDRLQPVAEPTIYRLLHSSRLGPTLWILAAVPPAGGSLNALRSAVTRVAGTRSVEVSTLEDKVEETTSAMRDFAYAGAAISMFTLGLVGLSGIVTIRAAVVRRRREIGVRMALGATRRQLTFMLVRRSLLLTAPACIAGLAVGHGIGRLIESRLFGVDTADALVAWVAAFALIAVVMLASCVPIVRALRSEAITLLAEY